MTVTIFFVPGMFGSTLEYVLRKHTVEYQDPELTATIADDGSMHSFYKQMHAGSTQMLIEKLSRNAKINTPIYPFIDASLPEIIDIMKPTLGTKNVLVYGPDLRSCELNMLFQYRKIAVGSVYATGLDIFSGHKKTDIQQWNPRYQTWEDMQSWEWREWFSIFYTEWTREWRTSVEQVPDSFIKIKNVDILHNFETTVSSMLDQLGCTPHNNLKDFANQWSQKQQYILDEFELLDQIILHTVSGTEFKWDPVSPVAEAIVQQRLRAQGFEIRCQDLNTFPTDSIALHNLLESV